MCTLQILYLSKEQFVDGIFALLPNPISPRLWATRCFMWRGLDIKVTWLKNALLLFVELYVPKPDRLSLRLLVICSWICCHYSTLNKAAPHSQAMKCNSLTFLFLFFYLFFFIWFGRLPFVWKWSTNIHCAVTPWEHQIVPATHVSLQSNIWIQHLTATAAGAHSCKSWMFEGFFLSFLLVLVVQ